MSSTPAHIVGARGSPGTICLSSETLIRIRDLYLERHFKQCIAACEELLEPKLHPVHQVFLEFHQAISYESLGLMAHVYSNNKLPFLESAQEKFAAALQTLPQPYATNENGFYETPKPSPLTPNFVFLSGSDVFQSVSSTDSLLPDAFRDSRPDHNSVSDTNSETSSHYSDCPTSNFYTTPELSSSPARDDYDCNKVSDDDDGDVNTPRASQDQCQIHNIPSGHKTRLSTSLSNNHVMVDELVPSPLFRRSQKLALLPDFTYPNREELEPRNSSEHECADESEHETSENQLPKIPFSKATPTFKLQNGRHVLVPTRKTAIQTLINKFEGTLPTISQSSELISTATLNFPRTPITPRFNLIRNMFEPNPSNPNLESYLSSIPLARYNELLTELRTQILFHLSKTKSKIEEATKMQTKRLEQSRRNTTSITRTNHLGQPSQSMVRVASYWSFQPEPPIPTPRPHSAAFPLNPPAAVSITKTCITKRKDTSHRSDELKERIEKLRQAKFRVCKERYGFKGEAHYEELRHRAESELDIYMTD